MVNTALIATRATNNEIARRLAIYETGAAMFRKAGFPMQQCNTPSRRSREPLPAIKWYDAAFYPDSPVGFVYIVRLLRPYVAGVKKVRVGGHYEQIEGRRRYVGGVEQERAVTVLCYVGWAPCPWRRYDRHMSGHGSKLLRHLASIGWPMRLEVVTPGDRTLEARLKRLHNGAGILRAISPTYAEGW